MILNLFQVEEDQFEICFDEFDFLRLEKNAILVNVCNKRIRSGTIITYRTAIISFTQKLYLGQFL